MAPPSRSFMRLAALAALAALIVPLVAMSPKKLMQFGVEAAQQGLWNEAMFRWERAVKDDASNARLRNNLAVAYESGGRFEDADREYREARQIDPDNRDIRNNQESFLQMHPQFRKEGDPGPAPSGQAGHA